MKGLLIKRILYTKRRYLLFAILVSYYNFENVNHCDELEPTAFPECDLLIPSCLLTTNVRTSASEAPVLRTMLNEEVQTSPEILDNRS